MLPTGYTKKECSSAGVKKTGPAALQTVVYWDH